MALISDAWATCVFSQVYEELQEPFNTLNDALCFQGCVKHMSFRDKHSIECYREAAEPRRHLQFIPAEGATVVGSFRLKLSRHPLSRL